MGKDIIALIPARSGSKGVPDKNIKLLAGKPLLAYSIMVAKKIKLIGRVIVSTNSETYAAISKEYGAEVPVLRPEEFSGDRSTDYEFIKHMLDWLKDNENFQPEYIVHLRPTTPLRDPKVVKEAIISLMNCPDSTSLRSVHEMSESAYKTFEIEQNCLMLVCSNSFDLDTANGPRQMFKKTYQANGYVDVIRTSYVIKNNKIHGNRVFAYITPRVTEVDTVEDFSYLEYQLTKEPSAIKKLFG